MPHADIIGRPEGDHRALDAGLGVPVLRPTLEDVVVEMPRGAQVIYPKDLAPICMLADIGPGVRVFEIGRRLRGAVDDDAALGSDDRRLRGARGLRQPGPHERARVPRRGRARPTSASSCATATQGIDPADAGDGFDRVVLDLPEPWQVVPHAERALRPGGILVAYTPSITQAAQTREALKGKWIDARTIEVLHRGWHIEGQAVRPDHRMVAHTAFLTVARWLG